MIQYQAVPLQARLGTARPTPFDVSALSRDSDGFPGALRRVQSGADGLATRKNSATGRAKSRDVRADWRGIDGREGDT